MPEPITYGELLTAPAWHCDVCRVAAHFFAVLRGRLLCAECWKREGSRFPRDHVSDEEIFRREQATRERMKARGGTARHLVNAGKA